MENWKYSWRVKLVGPGRVIQTRAQDLEPYLRMHRYNSANEFHRCAMIINQTQAEVCARQPVIT